MVSISGAFSARLWNLTRVPFHSQFLFFFQKSKQALVSQILLLRETNRKVQTNMNETLAMTLSIYAY